MRALRHSLSGLSALFLLGLTQSCSSPPPAEPPSLPPTGPRIDRSGYVRVGADSLFFEVAGSGPTVVLIHDGAVHREVWNEQMDAFSAHYQVVRYDRRGYGKSPPPTESFSNAEDLDQVLEALEIQHASIVGMSSGGRISIDFALDHPEKVTALVLVGAPVGGFPFTPHLADRGGHMPQNLPPAELLAYLATEDPYEIWEGNPAVRERIRALLESSPFPDQGSFATSPEVPAVTRLHEIRVPTLILAGEFDAPDVHAHAGALNLGIASSTREIVRQAGHLVPAEQPEVFNQRVLEFLGGV